MPLFDRVQKTLLGAEKASRSIDSDFLRLEEYRCALVASEVYGFTDLAHVDMPFAEEKEFDRVFTDPEAAKKIFYADESGVRCRMYHDLRGDGHIIGFGGTVPTKVDDWINNFRQWSGLRTAQYERGIALAAAIRPRCRAKIIFTGHSLGGGIATVAALSREIRGIVFNPPGINRKTLANYDATADHADQLIRRFVVRGEILNQINKIPFQPLLRPGATHKLWGSFTIPVARSAAIIFAAARLLRHPALIASATAIAPILQKSIDLHGMDEVFFGLAGYLRER